MERRTVPVRRGASAGLPLCVFMCVAAVGCVTRSTPTAGPDEVAPELARPKYAVPFAMYSAPSELFDRLRTAGFTAVGPYYGATDRSILDQAEQAGLGVIYSVGFHRTAPFVLPDAEKAGEAIRSQVLAVQDRDVIEAWYLHPEEIKTWDEAELRFLEVATRAIAGADTGNREVLTYAPNHSSRARLTVLSERGATPTKGMYVDFAGYTQHRVWARWSVEQLLGARRSPHTRVLAVPEMFRDPPDSAGPSVATRVRHDVYLSLVSGADSVLVYSGARRRGFSAYDEYLSAYELTASELNISPRIGAVLALGTPAHVSVRVQAEPARRRIELLAAEGFAEYPVVAWAARDYGADTWVVVVNSSPTSSRVCVSSASSGSEVISPARGRLDVVDGEVCLPISPWGVDFVNIAGLARGKGTPGG